ncbi:hypothetical protein [Candidatus Synchoanobacter obligatus]|uniref:Uncharacterized protein n=1 Tax=Candidatus Synchoanobacter obligatus TaxID=2919597 RepID=A0ABT1L571_9GAMM|nr:hypothetical protein [Candidatus Synchoanobacter obligatus]MCP8352327.1 hypothetical protein [Candidatus Synchoanobacter obligatus]
MQNLLDAAAAATVVVQRSRETQVQAQARNDAITKAISERRELASNDQERPIEQRVISILEYIKDGNSITWGDLQAREIFTPEEEPGVKYLLNASQDTSSINFQDIEYVGPGQYISARFEINKSKMLVHVDTTAHAGHVVAMFAKTHNNLTLNLRDKHNDGTNIVPLRGSVILEYLTEIKEKISGGHTVRVSQNKEDHQRYTKERLDALIAFGEDYVAEHKQCHWADLHEGFNQHLLDENGGLQAQLAAAVNDLTVAETKADDSKEAVASLKLQLEEANTRATKAESDKTSLESKVAEATERADTAEKQLDAAKQEGVIAIARATEAEGNLKGLKSELAEAKADTKSSKDALVAMEEKVTSLEAELLAERSKVQNQEQEAADDQSFSLANLLLGRFIIGGNSKRRDDDQDRELEKHIFTPEEVGGSRWHVNVLEQQLKALEAQRDQIQEGAKEAEAKANEFERKLKLAVSENDELRSKQSILGAIKEEPGGLQIERLEQELRQSDQKLAEEKLALEELSIGYVELEHENERLLQENADLAVELKSASEAAGHGSGSDSGVASETEDGAASSEDSALSVKALEDRLVERAAINLEVMRENDQLKAKVRRLEGLKSDADRVRGLEEQLDAGHAPKRELEAKIQTLEAKVASLNGDLETQQEEIDKVGIHVVRQDSLDRAKAEIRALGGKLESQEVVIKEKEALIEQLREDLDAAKKPTWVQDTVQSMDPSSRGGMKPK